MRTVVVHRPYLGLGNYDQELVRLAQLFPSQYEPLEIDALIVDGAAFVNMLKPKVCKTILEYAQTIFLPYLKQHLTKVNRLDLVWDRYLPNSLNTQKRSKIGKGIRRRVQPDSRIPGN